jgi:hypothetical protein
VMLADGATVARVGFNAELGAPVAHRGGNRHHFGSVSAGLASRLIAMLAEARPTSSGTGSAKANERAATG